MTEFEKAKKNVKNDAILFIVLGIIFIIGGAYFVINWQGNPDSNYYKAGIQSLTVGGFNVIVFTIIYFLVKKDAPLGGTLSLFIGIIKLFLILEAMIDGILGLFMIIHAYNYLKTNPKRQK
jgi:hypothetical protein